MTELAVEFLQGDAKHRTAFAGSQAHKEKE